MHAGLNKYMDSYNTRVQFGPQMKVLQRYKECNTETYKFI